MTLDIRTIWNTKSQYPQFNLELATSENGEAFLVVKSCKIATGSNGQFVSGPSTKKQDGTYFNLTFMSKSFQAVVLKKALASQPSQQPVNVQEKMRAGYAPSNANSGFDDMDSDIPF